MADLPTSVRLSLWATRAFSGAVGLPTAVRLSAPDADHVEGALTTLQAWSDLGERVVLVALPRPGDLGGLPRGGADFIDAALAAGECVFVPGVGGALVPEVSEYGPEGDRGLAVRWAAHDCDPVPTHVIEALSLREIDRHVRAELMSATAALESGGGGPWASRELRELADEKVGSGRWGLPDDLPSGAGRLIRLSGVVAAAARLALDHPDDSIDRFAVQDRREVLLRLAALGERSLAEATCVGALALAGMTHERR